MPQQNGVAERMNTTLIDIVRSMMSYLDLTIFIWGHGLETIVYIINLQIPNQSLTCRFLKQYNMWIMVHQVQNLHNITLVIHSYSLCLIVLGGLLFDLASICSRKSLMIVSLMNKVSILVTMMKHSKIKMQIFGKRL